MRQLRHCLVLVCGVSLVWLPSERSLNAFQQSGPPAAAAQPTAAELALLTNSWDLAASQKVLAAIGAGDPIVRAVAARVAALSTMPQFGNAITKVMATEQDPAALAEQMRALLIMGGPQAAGAVEARLGSSRPAIKVYVEWLARGPQDRFVAALPTLKASLGNDDALLNQFVERAARTSPAASEPLLRAWLGASSGDSWGLLVDRLLQNPLPEHEPVLIDALASPKADIRDATVWSLVSVVSRNGAVSDRLLDAAATTGTGASDTPPTWELFGRELLARRHRRAQTPDRSAFLTSEAGARVGDAITVARMPQANDAERRALKTVLADDFPDAWKNRVAAEIAKPPDRWQPSMRTVPSPWPGFLKAVLQAAKCVPDRTPFAVALVKYRPEGVVADISSVQTGASKECTSAMNALARLTVMDVEYRISPEGELLLLPIEADFLTCADAMNLSSFSSLPTIGRQRRGQKIVPPKKARDQKPDYPEEMQRRRVQGTVVLESIITSTGCIADLRVARGVAPALDIAALRAVSRWQFTPSILDGQQVPVRMTVTVNFTLR